MMRFTKIKWDTKEVLLRWTTEKGGETHDHEVTAKAPPHPDFVTALKALREDVINICELPISYESGLRVQSVTMSRSEKTGIEGAVVTALKTLASASSPLVLNTPYLVDDPAAETGAMTREMASRLSDLRFEAERYIEGKRAQGELFTPSAAEQRANDEAGAGETTEFDATAGVPGASVKVDGRWVEATQQNVGVAVERAIAGRQGRRGRPGSDQD